MFPEMPGKDSCIGSSIYTLGSLSDDDDDDDDDDEDFKIL